MSNEGQKRQVEASWHDGNIVTPIFSDHSIGLRNALQQHKAGLMVRYLGILPEHIDAFPLADRVMARSYYPSVIAVDTVQASDESDILFLYPSHVFRFREKREYLHEEDVFFVGADCVDINGLFESFAPNAQDTRVAVLSYINQRMPFFSRESIGANEVTDQHCLFDTSFRNALIATKTAEARMRLGEEARGPAIAMMGSAHELVSDVWKDGNERERVLLEVFTGICNEVKGKREFTADEVGELAKDLSNVFGMTKVWRVKERPDRRWLRVSQLNELVPVEEIFVSGHIMEIVREAVTSVFDLEL